MTEGQSIDMAYRVTEFMLHAAGHFTSGDQGWAEALEIVARLNRGEDVPSYTAAEVISELRGRKARTCEDCGKPIHTLVPSSEEIEVI